VAAVVWCAGVAPAFGAEIKGTIVKLDGSVYTGTMKYLPVSKKYVVTLEGSAVTWEIPAIDVRSVDIPEPPDLRAAVQKINAGQFAAAIPALEQVKSDYAKMQWDTVAAGYLGEVYRKTGKSREALRMYEQVLEANPDAAQSAEFAPKYWDLLLEIGEAARLRAALSRAVESGSRPLAAFAQIKRGDIDRKNGKLQDALIDGYLRTALLFGDVKEAKPEALYWTVKCFQELQRHTDADKWRRRLLAEFPESEYNEKLRAGT
jgi:tetratricopeptide (TPR) repeat protein